MTPEAQRIAISEACGWSEIGICVYGDDKGQPKGKRDFPWRVRLPDYLHSLDAMHEAEKMLTTWELRSKYVNYLDTVIPESGLCFAEDEAAVRYFNAFQAVHATAADKAVAFLRTLNLWTK